MNERTTEKNSLCRFSSKKCAYFDEKERVRQREIEWMKRMYSIPFIQCCGHLHFYTIAISLNQCHLLTLHIEKHRSQHKRTDGNCMLTIYYGLDWTEMYIKYFITFFFIPTHYILFGMIFTRKMNWSMWQNTTFTMLIPLVFYIHDDCVVYV